MIRLHRLASSLLATLCLLLALSPAARAQLTLPGTLSMSPSAATGGGTIRIGATHLADGDYEVSLLGGRDPLVLVDIANGGGEFSRYVTLPTLPAGNYTVELRVNGALAQSRSYKILPPLGVTPATASPRAGSTLAFTVSGLTDGSLSLAYAGKVAFGPVNVSAGSYSGKLVLPTDRPASLPASVVLEARNSTGKTVPRVGSTTLSVQTPDRSPIFRIGSSTPSSSSIPLRQPLAVNGSVATNEFDPVDGSVQYWWRDSLGRVVPMGAQSVTLAANGNFSAEARAPQVGTLSAIRASGNGSVFAVGQARDRYGNLQQQPSLDSSLSVSVDTDEAIDITLNLRGSDGLPIENARVVLSTSQLDDLYPPNDNSAPIRLDGGPNPVAMPTQFDAVNDEVLGCPDDLERQASNAQGRVNFEFGLSLPQTGVNVDGSGPPPTVTIEPSEDCIEIPTNPGDSTAHCTLVDPAGIHAQLMVIASHTGYGWLTSPGGNGIPVERPLMIDLRIDRYTGHIESRVCEPDTNPLDAYDPPCVEGSADGNLTMNLVLPKLASSGLLINDPQWTQGANVQWPEVTGRDGLIVNYAPLPDLSGFQGKANFFPASPLSRKVQVSYVRGAGNTLSSLDLHLPGEPALVVPLSKTGGNDSCDVSATEVWSADVPLQFLEALRFPQERFGANPTTATGYVIAKEEGTTRSAARAFRFHFTRTPQDILALADLPCPAGQASPCLDIDTYRPHAVKLSLPPNDSSGTTSTGSANTGGCDSSDCDDYAELQSQKNEAQAHLDLQLCLPVNATGCGSYSAVNSSHLQYNRSPDTQPPGQSFQGAAAGSQPNRPWETLFDKTIPLFRWYWGVPEVFSAEVFADLRLKAEYLFNYVVKPLQPMQSYIETGGKIDVGIMVGVDVDVLFGILVDAGAAITGSLVGEVVAKSEASAPANPCIEEDLRFRLDFSYWVEIGCPIDFPLDPTCWIPDIEGSNNIFNESIVDGSSCLARSHSAPSAWGLLDRTIAEAASGAAMMKANPVIPVRPSLRRAMNRHPAISVDSAGNRLILYINDLGKLVANDRPVDGLPATTQLSDAWGLRDVAVMHYGVDRAVAVWAQSDLRAPPADGADLASRQHLFFAIFDGDTWGAATALTAPGYGEGGVRLARCVPRAGFYRGDCLSNKVGLVFQRNTGRVSGGESHIYLSEFDGVDWSRPTRVDQSGLHNITPAITYKAAQAVVAWVRYAPDATGLSDVDKRYLAIRSMDGASNEQLDTRSNRVAQPDLATTSDGQLAIAYTRAAASDGFVGTRQGLQLGRNDCSTGNCVVRAFAVKDEYGRPVYGERPRLVANAEGGVNVAFRALSFGALPGAANPESNAIPSDPPGIRSGHGELLNIVSKLSSAQTRVQLQSNDGAGHLQPAIAFDPANQQVVTVSAQLPAEILGVSRLATEGPRLLAKVQTLDDSLQMATLPVLPDLAMETLQSDATILTPGAEISVNVGVINGGAGWLPTTGKRTLLRLHWDTPATRETLYGNLDVPALAPGQRFETTLQVPVPVAFHDDERQTLRAELLVDDPDGEIDGANNSASLSIGGMPVPTGLRALSAPGSRIVNLGWDDPADPRVAGYRIWVDDADGRPQPVGSSFNLGFADLSALYGFTRSYRVSTYSERGVESELSEPVLAAPSPAILTGESARVFSDSFE
ncbi:MAG: hypothetical protein R3F01_07255 [Lysobacteraceae bacterium]